MQNTLRGEGFVSKLGGKLSIIILHFWYNMQYIKNAEL